MELIYCLWLQHEQGPLVKIIFSKNDAKVMEYSELPLENITIAEPIDYFFVPGEWVTAHELPPFPVKQKQLYSAIAYSLEEKLAQEPESLHFAFFNHQHRNKVEVYVIAKEKMHWIHGFCSEHHISLTWLLPDYCLVPYDAQKPHLLIVNHRLLYRDHPFLAWSADINIGKQILLSQVRTSKDTIQISANILSESEKTVPEKLEVLEPFICNYENIYLTNLLKQFLNQNCNFHLLQHEFYQRKALSAEKKVWRNTAYFFIAYLSSIFLINCAQYYYYSFENHQITKQIEKEYLNLFPNASMEDDIEQQIKSKLNQLYHRQDNKLLSTLVGIGKALEATKNIKIEDIQYSNNKLILQIKAFNFDDVRAFQKLLKQNNILFSQDSISENQNIIAMQLSFS